MHFEHEVSEIRRDGNQVAGIVTKDEFHRADIIVSNMEVIPAYRELLDEESRFVSSLEKSTSPRVPVSSSISGSIVNPATGSSQFFLSRGSAPAF